VVIKPNISGGSDYTYRLNQQQMIQQSTELTGIFANRAMMIQPFIPEIVDHGEWSLFFFNNQFSHCIIKKPKAGDFRVQEEHGGKLQLVTPPTDLLAIASEVTALLQPEPLYIRADFVFDGEQYLLIEVELIEPSLYFNMDEQAATRFAEAIDTRFGGNLR
jgi:glutathione synthase/RimK-type ligase-like ATP-grasp enzyme